MVGIVLDTRHLFAFFIGLQDPTLVIVDLDVDVAAQCRDLTDVYFAMISRVGKSHQEMRESCCVILMDFDVCDLLITLLLTPETI